MAGRHFGAVYRRIERIFAAGSVAGMSEGELLDRFATRGDEAAFEAILARHGPMVLGICRQVLRDPNDVDDAFQATFLVLVRKAGSLRQRDLLGNWLFGVAWRVALRARSVAARRRTVEGSREAAGVRPETAPTTDHDHESGAILHQELRQLPENYRTAVLLCYLEGLTHEEAARQLGWPLGTVKGRLARARELLRKRLTRRGVNLSASAVSAAVARQAQATVPAALVQSTIKAALAVAAGRGLAAGVIAANVAALMKGVSDAMFLNTLKLVVMVLVAGVITTGAGVWAFQDRGSRASPATRTRPQASPNSPAVVTGPVTVRSGREAIAALAPYVAARDKTPATRAIVAKLEESVSMSFANETPLEDVIHYIKAATKGPNDPGIQVYVDPVGLGEAKTTSTSPVRLDLQNVPLKTTLRLLLKQLDLAYCVKDGLLIISSVERVLQELKEAEAFDEGALGPGTGVPAEARAAAPVLPPQPPVPLPKEDVAEVTPSSEPPQVTQPGAPGAASPSETEAAAWAAIQRTLDAPIKLSIAKDTPLRDVFKSLKKVAVPPGGRAIPVYLDPAVDAPAMSSDFDVEGVPLRTVVSLLLSQAGLGWDIFDNVLIVSNAEGLQSYRRVAAHFTIPGPAYDDMGPRNLSHELRARLTAPITLTFPKPTPLEEVMTSIRDATKGADGAGISLFYGPPANFQTEASSEAQQKRIGSLPVQLDVNDVPLRTCLALLLGQQPRKVFDRTSRIVGQFWPPLDGRLIDGVLIIGTHDWVQSIQIPHEGLQYGSPARSPVMTGGAGMR